jgi:predicted aspartyl protease
MRVVYVVLLMLSISAADAKDKPRDSAVRFEFAADTSLVLVPIYVNGHGPYRFLLDTGASHSVLSQEVADRLEIPRGRAEKLITAGGAVPVTIRQLDALQFGAARIVRLSIAVANLVLLADLRVDGILGGDCLRYFNPAIDYAGKVVRIEPSSERHSRP